MISCHSDTLQKESILYHVPNTVISRYESILKKREVPIASFKDYKKWLRYFHDFCAKHPVPEPKSEQVRLFIEKLREKKQTGAQCRQAAHAISIYFEMQRDETSSGKSDDEKESQQCSLAAPASLPLPVVSQRKSQYSAAG
jgi:hypothetical protein